MDNQAHAILAPSSAPVWGRCSGNIPASLGKLDPETEAKLNGQAAHWVAEQCLMVWRDVNGGTAKCADWLDKVAPNGVVVDEIMVDGAQVFVDDVLAVCQEHGGLRNLLIEQRVQSTAIHPESSWGTLDTALYLPLKRLLFIWDYKHGYRETRARDNLQLVDYMQGLKELYNIDGQTDQHIRFSARIVQPNCYKAIGAVDVWDGTLSDIRGHVNQLHIKAHEALTAPTMSPGLHCRDCPAVGRCSAARRSLHSWGDFANSPYEIDTMNGQELAVERRILSEGLKAGKARLEAIEDELVHRIRKGERDTGLALHTEPGRLKFTVPDAQAIVFAQGLGIDIAKTVAITPTQAIKKAPREIRDAFASALKSITERPNGNLTLIDAEDSIGQRAFKRK